MRLLRLIVLAIALLLAAPPAGRSELPDVWTPQVRRSWESRYREAIQRVEDAQARQVAATRAYREMRHRRRARGERKAAILAELEAAEKALQEAKRELAEFEAQARRDGVPPGWMREVREAGTGPASPEAP